MLAALRPWPIFILWSTVGAAASPVPVAAPVEQGAQAPAASPGASGGAARVTSGLSSAQSATEPATDSSDGAAVVPLAEPAPPDGGGPLPEASDGADAVALASLEPLFTSGPLGEAKLAFDAALYPRALALLDAAAQGAPLPPEARYLRAVALMRAGLSVQAVPEFLSVAEALPSLRSRCRFSAAVALEEEQAFAQAAALYAEVGPASPNHRDALLGEARMLVAQHQVTKAAELLAPLSALPAPGAGFGRDVGAEALFGLAKLDERRGLVASAALRYRALWLKHPLSQIAEAAFAQATALGAKAPSAGELVARAELLLAANRNQPAIDALQPLARALKLKPRSAVACEAHFALAKAEKKQRHHTEALAEFGRVLDGCRSAADADLRARALYLAGQSAAVVDPPRAKGFFAQLAKEYPESSFADDALFFEADVEATSLVDAPAAKASLRALVEKYPTGDYADEARFKLFWLSRHAALKGGDPDTSPLEALIAGLPAAAPRPPEPVLRARYWLAQAQSDPVGLSLLADDWPANYYGDLARHALLSSAPAPGPQPAAAVPSAPPAFAAPPAVLHAGTLRADPNFAAGLTLLRVGLLSAADEEFSRVDRQGVSGLGGRGEPLLLLSLALSHAGDARASHAVAKALVETADVLGGSERAGLRTLLFEVAYPRAFRPLIEKWSRVAAVPPDLLQGLMREESALDPLALSGAGAVGLCQLMPATGKWVARKLGLGVVSAQQLQDPELNIRLGAAYLGELLKRYEGREPLAVAAYNAGEGAVDRWLAAANGTPLDAFVEEIPVAETRHYVKRVLTSAAVYRTLPFDDKLVAAQ